MPPHSKFQTALDLSFISSRSVRHFDATPLIKFLPNAPLRPITLPMRAPIFFHYCSHRTHCNHYYLTVFTSALLLFVGCSSMKTAREDNTAPSLPVVKMGTNMAPSPRPSPPVGEKEKTQFVEGTTNWQSLFDGQTLRGWEISDFAGRGEVHIENGKILLEQGVMTGITWTNSYPKMNYEIALDAMRVKGSDFFCGRTFPVGENP